MQITVPKFFGFLQDNMDACLASASKHAGRPDSSCLNPNNYQRISTIFNSFLAKYPQFDRCTALHNSKLYACTANDGTGDYLLIDTDPSRFGMEILNDQKNRVGKSGDVRRWFGHRIHCFPSVSSDKIAYNCAGNLPETDRYSYYLSETKEGVCDDNYSPNPLKGGYVASDCNNDLPLFDKFLSHATFEEISFLSRAWSFTKLVAGSTGTLYLGYKTIRELNNLGKAFTKTSGKNKKDQLLVEKDASKSKVTKHVLQNNTLIESSKKRVLAYGIATLASFIFTTTTYFTDFSGVYLTGTGQPIRFK